MIEPGSAAIWFLAVVISSALGGIALNSAIDNGKGGGPDPRNKVDTFVPPRRVPLPPPPPPSAHPGLQ